MSTVSGRVMAIGALRATRYALNHQAEPCQVTVAISHLPAGCTAATATQTRNLVTGVDTANRAVMQFDITCPNSATNMSQDATGEDMLMGPPADTPTGYPPPH